MAQHTWDDCWNDVKRHVQFRDEEQKQAMAIPKSDMNNIQLFRDKYLVEDAMADAQITNEAVRVCYWFDMGYPINNHIQRRLIRFDIYVKEDQRYNVDPVDRFKQREKVIADRLLKDLTGQKCVEGLTFWHENAYSAISRVVGYTRYHTYFSYKVSV